MSVYRSSFQKLAFSTFLIAFPLNAAFAQDTAAVAERLKAKLVSQGIDISWTGVSGDASEMVLQGVSVKPAAEGHSLAIGDIKLEGIAEANGGYTIETVSTSPYSSTKDGMTFDMSPFVIHGMTLPAEGGTDPLGSLMMYKGAELSSASVKVGDKTAFSMSNFTAQIIPPADGKAMEFTGKAEKFTGDLSLVEDPKSKAVIEALGYQNITGNIDVAGSWQPSDGKMQFSKYNVTVDNAGTLGMTFDLGGYTTEFIKSVQALQKKMAEAPEGEDKSAMGLAVLGLMQQLSFNSASIRFDDASLTGKVLDYVAKQQGMSAKDIANQAKAIVPFGMAQLNNPELTAQVTEAVGKYLDNPKSLEIAARPLTPVPFSLIMAGGMSNPLELPKTLGVSVTANQ